MDPWVLESPKRAPERVRLCPSSSPLGEKAELVHFARQLAETFFIYWYHFMQLDF